MKPVIIGIFAFQHMDIVSQLFSILFGQ